MGLLFVAGLRGALTAAPVSSKCTGPVGDGSDDKVETEILHRTCSELHESNRNGQADAVQTKPFGP